MQSTSLQAAQPELPAPAQAQLFTGHLRMIAPGIQSGIQKAAISGNIYIGFDGLEFDSIADSRHHGGVDRAVLLYPREHYATLVSHGFSSAGAPGSFGENVSVSGWREDKVCIGDICRLGNAILQVSQPRSPCFKLGIQLDNRKAPLFIQQNALTGYFFRVLTPAYCNGMENLDLIERPEPTLTVKTACELFFNRYVDFDAVAPLIDSAAISSHWREKVKKRLLRNQVEPWDNRLYGTSDAK